MSSTARDGVRTGLLAGSGEAASLVESATLLRWRAPELALLLADRAVTAAQDDQAAVLRADQLAVFALNRLGRHGEAAHRLFPAIRSAHTPAGLRHELHVELAHCAAALGESATALGAVRAVLAAGDDVAPVLRGTALVAAAEAAGALGRWDLFTPALDEADELYREDPSLDRDTALLLRATARAADAARHRRRGAAAEAEAQARAGRELLSGLADPEHDSGELSARLMLEIVLALLDRDDHDAAIREVRPLLRRPVRASAAGAVGRLRLALATRVHLAQGRHEPALTLLADAVEGAQRHGVDAVLAECLEGLSHVHEARGEFADALHCVRAARAAEGRHRRNVEAARATLLEHCGLARRELAGLVDQVAALLVNAGSGCAGSDPDNGVPVAEVTADDAPDEATETPVAQISEPEFAEIPQVQPPPVETPEVQAPVVQASEEQISEVEVPEVETPDAETAEVQAEAEASEVEASEVEPSEVGLAEVEIPDAELSEEEAPDVEAPDVEASDVEAVAVETSEAAETVELEIPAAQASQPFLAEQAAELPSAQPPIGGQSWQSGARHRRGADTLVRVSDLLPASALSAGRSGRRRAEEPAEGHRGASGPPPAPTPRAMGWEAGDVRPASDGDSPQLGLGDLLAEALAAYQQSRVGDTAATGRYGDEGAADVGSGRKAPPYGRPGTRGTTGLALAAPISRREDDPSEALTNPLLRLPDLTAEPLWIPPEVGRQSAAGD